MAISTSSKRTATLASSSEVACFAADPLHIRVGLLRMIDPFAKYVCVYSFLLIVVQPVVNCGRGTFHHMSFLFLVWSCMPCRPCCFDFSMCISCRNCIAIRTVDLSPQHAGTVLSHVHCHSWCKSFSLGLFLVRVSMYSIFPSYCSALAASASILKSVRIRCGCVDRLSMRIDGFCRGSFS